MLVQAAWARAARVREVSVLAAESRAAEWADPPRPVLAARALVVGPDLVVAASQASVVPVALVVPVVLVEQGPACWVPRA